MNVKIQKFLIPLFLVILTSCSPSVSRVDLEIDADAAELALPTTVSSVYDEPRTQRLPVCLDVSNALFCVVEVAVTPNDIKVMLGLIPDSKVIEPGSLVFALPDTEREERITLLDENGHSLSLIEDSSDFLATFDSERQIYKQTLVFEAIKQGIKKLTLKIPIVSIKVLDMGSFQVDLGSNPEVGQVIPLDTTFSVGDQVFHLNKAEFEGDGSGSLRVTLYSEPIDLPDTIASIQPVLGASEGISVGFGSKTIVDGWPFRAFADLIPQPGQAPVSGVINVPVQGMIYNYRGPFEITFQLP